MVIMEDRVQKALQEADVVASNTESSNRERRMVYSNLGLLELDIEELREQGKVDIESATRYLEVLRKAQDACSLGYLKKQPKGFYRLFYFVDEALRIAAVWCYLIDFAVIVTPLSMVTHILFPRMGLANTCRRACGAGCYILSNVNVKREGLTEKTFASTVSLLNFTHASTMDAFILAGVVPCGLYSLAKSELFLIPFFAWILAAYGGIAVNRGDQNQAVKALRSSAERAQRTSSQGSGSCVAMSPEGTRSKSGQLAVFKKGPFYTWEDLQSPIVPMVIFGAFDLYPPGRQMSLPGTVVVRFLPPIMPQEVKATEPAARRKEMSSLLRRKVLLTLQESPNGVGDESPPQTIVEKVKHLGIVGACLGANYTLLRVVTQAGLRRGWSLTSMGLASAGTTIIISGAVYLYNLLLCTPLGGAVPGPAGVSGKGPTSTSMSDGNSTGNKKDN
jgi:1-acyl-sn-glycerol-3-phosphate acyltransferase